MDCSAPIHTSGDPAYNLMGHFIDLFVYACGRCCSPTFDIEEGLGQSDRDLDWIKTGFLSISSYDLVFTWLICVKFSLGGIRMKRVICDVSTEELLQLVTDAGGFEWLDDPGEDVYSTGETSYSVLELKGLGKEIWQGIDAQEYVDQERRSSRE